MKVLLVRMPYYNLLNFKANFYPLWAGYLSSSLKLDNHEVSLLDGEIFDFGLYRTAFSSNKFNQILSFLMPYHFARNFKVLDDIMSNRGHRVWEVFSDHIIASDADVVGISCYSQNLTSVRVLSDKLKARKNLVLVVGGVHPSCDPSGSYAALPKVDYIVVGEGESTLRELCSNLNEGRMADSIRGVYSPDKYTPRSMIKELDEIPYLDRKLGDYKEYHPNYGVFSARGCPYNCSFCASKVLWGRKVRFHSVDYIINELRLLKRDFGANRVRFQDDTFCISKERTIDICRKIIESGLNDISYSVGTRVETVDDELVDWLRSAGVDTLSLGIESGSPKVRKLINKNFSDQQVIDGIKAGNKVGIVTYSYYMIGHPGETKEDIRMSKDLIKKSKTKRVDVNVAVPYPGTKLMNIAKKQGYRFDLNDYYKMDHHSGPLMNLTNLPNDLFKREIQRFMRFTQLHSVLSKIRLVFKYLVVKLKRQFA